jgi:hypothetical protein
MEIKALNLTEEDSLLDIMIAVLDNTAEFFNSDNRSFYHGTGDCAFFDDNGNRCALGRLTTIEKAKELEYSNLLEDSKPITLECLLKKHLVPPFDILPFEFLDTLRDLHDDSNNWNSEGLSEAGKLAYKSILLAIENNAYPYQAPFMSDYLWINI